MASPEFGALVELLAATRLSGAVPVADQRAAIDGLANLLAVAEGVAEHHVDAAGVPGRWLVPPAGSSSDPVAVLWLHGGGYNIGSSASHRAAASVVAAALGHPVLVCDYRLAPEHPWPGAPEDANTVWQWLIDHGRSPAHVGVVGDSAGGGLALTLTQRLAADGRDVPGALALLCPWVDLTGSEPAPPERRDADVVLDVDQLATWARSYAGDCALDDPGVSPLFGPLAGLPPILIHAGGRDSILDDSVRLAEAATAAGADVALRIEPEMIHAWHLFATAFPEATASLTEVATWLGSHLGRPGGGDHGG
jgi:acetyl esterase/lipase